MVKSSLLSARRDGSGQGLEQNGPEVQGWWVAREGSRATWVASVGQLGLLLLGGLQVRSLALMEANKAHHQGVVLGVTLQTGHGGAHQ